MRDLLNKSVFLFLIIFLDNNSLSLANENKNAVIPRPYSTTVTWVTDKPTTSQIEYGKTPSDTQITPEDTNLVIYHKVILFDLNPSTSYNYRIISKDAYGNETRSENLTFVTSPEPSKDQPPQITDIEASSILGSGPGEPESEKTSSGTAQEEKQLIKKEEPIEKALMERGGILLKKGKLQIEPSMTYVYTSANRITIEGYTVLPLVIGEISTAKVKRNIFLESLSARYGLKRDLQVELNVPYRYQHERTTVDSPSSETIKQASGIGDMSTGIFYQCAYEKGPIPDLIAGISVKYPTGKEPYGHDIGLGTGHWGFKTSLVAVKSSDPAILFSSLAYTYNVKRNDIEGYGTIKPGDSIDYSLGAAFALNYQIALSFQLQQSITQKMRLNHNSVNGSFTNVVSFKYGLTWSMSQNLSCEVSATHGLTTDSPDFALGVSFPYTF